MTALPVLLFGLIFLWTPPHFWSLALFVRGDYANAGVPMLPVTHGARVTRNQILAYTPLLVGVSLVPWAMRLTGAIYGVTAVALGVVFMALAVAVFRNDATDPAAMRPERRLFTFSILYLFVMFGALVADRWLLA